MQQGRQQEPHDNPFNTIPAVVVVLVLAIFGVEVLLLLAKSGFIGNTRGGEDWRIFAIQRFAFSGEILAWMIETGRWPLDHLQRFVTYLFVHASFTHAVMVCVFVLALGKMVGETFSQTAVVAVFFGAGIAGALAYGLLLDNPYPLLGGYPGAYGLIGAFTFILWVGLGRAGQNQLQAFRLIGFLLGIQLLFGLIFGSNPAWVAELTGFVTGFALSGVLRPGGWAQLLDRLRQR
ncbi:rhomboid family intramembrane serine protease [Tropicimonas sediminicola]|uniref:Rhomboid family protein n=1 Tax=Tropicimonas sediminicola TaxID=1031541 RepID=A0A239F023_9RHOB|nr:rhomboid family intramembrane serine protease [Tropicimonas sediminicola]SNS49434.1 Rhomboid family protein [Tropicimonas sediminicola]